MKASILRFARLKTRTRKVLMLCAASTFLAVAAFFATAHYGADGAGIRYISRPPLLTISWGSRSRFIIQDGINLVRDRAPWAQAGNFIEFGLPFSESRVSLRLFSWSWLSEEYVGWRSNHAAGLMKKRPEPSEPTRLSGPQFSTPLLRSSRLRQGLPAYGGARGDQGYGGQTEPRCSKKTARPPAAVAYL